MAFYLCAGVEIPQVLNGGLWRGLLLAIAQSTPLESCITVPRLVDPPSTGYASWESSTSELDPTARMISSLSTLSVETKKQLASYQEVLQETQRLQEYYYTYLSDSFNGRDVASPARFCASARPSQA